MTGSICDLKFYFITLTFTSKEREKERSHDKGYSAGDPKRASLEEKSEATDSAYVINYYHC